MNLQEFFDYKNKIMETLCSNKRIVQLVTDSKSASIPNRDLPYTQIYPYEFIPETVDEGMTFICYDVDIDEVVEKPFYIPVIYIWVFTHKSKLKLDEGGVRIDELAKEIDKELNGSRFLGLGELNLSSVGRFSPTTDYLGRVLTYYTKDFNRIGSKKPPSNRKA